MSEITKTSIENFILRKAEINDVGIILGFIKELAEYEKLSHEVMATEELLKISLFENKYAEVIIGEFDKKPVGYCLYFYSFSTFLGKPGIYLEDLYITPLMRGRGFGKTLLSNLAKIAVERNCGRLEWSCLNWNKSAINLYKSMGAVSMDEWTGFRVTGENLLKLAGNN